MTCARSSGEEKTGIPYIQIKEDNHLRNADSKFSATVPSTNAMLQARLGWRGKGGGSGSGIVTPRLMSCDLVSLDATAEAAININ